MCLEKIPEPFKVFFQPITIRSADSSADNFNTSSMGEPCSRYVFVFIPSKENLDKASYKWILESSLNNKSIALYSFNKSGEISGDFST